MKIDDIEIITPKEKALLKQFNNTDGPINDDTVVSIFEEQVKNTPEKTALVSNNMSFSYEQLNKKANMLAHYLKDTCNIKPNDIVGIMLNRCPEMIIGLLAILKCGATYLPIDPEYPKERISYMLENSHTRNCFSKYYNRRIYSC